MWDGEDCWILGGGFSVPLQFGVPKDVINGVCERRLPASAYSDYFKPIHDKHVIGINNAYKIGDWIDVCFFGDCTWYLLHKLQLERFPGLLVTCCPRFETKNQRQMEGIKYLAKDKDHTQGISPNPSKVSWNNNSGAAAISLAYHFGAKRIMLLGFDMNMDKWSHWHGSHSPNIEKKKRKPPFSRHLRGFSAISDDAKRMGIEIYNLSPNSAVEPFKKVSLEDVL
jgi:hypothetical protein